MASGKITAKQQEILEYIKETILKNSRQVGNLWTDTSKINLIPSLILEH